MQMKIRKYFMYLSRQFMNRKYTATHLKFSDIKIFYFIWILVCYCSLETSPIFLIIHRMKGLLYIYLHLHLNFTFNCSCNNVKRRLHDGELSYAQALCLSTISDNNSNQTLVVGIDPTAATELGICLNCEGKWKGVAWGCLRNQFFVSYS